MPGGTAVEFQNMQDEYKTLLMRLQQKHKAAATPQQESPENELINELGKLAEVLIRNQVPQNYLRQKIQTTHSSFKKGLFSDIVDFLDGL